MLSSKMSSTKILLLFSCVLLSKLNPSSAIKLDKRKTVKIAMETFDTLNEFDLEILNLNGPDIEITTDVNDAAYDSVVVITDNLNNSMSENLAPIKQFIESKIAENPTFGSSPTVANTSLVPSTRLIYAVVGGLSDEYSQVSDFGEVAKSAVGVAKAEGSTKPLLVILPPKDDARYSAAQLVSLLAIMKDNYKYLLARMRNKTEQIKEMGFWMDSWEESGQILINVSKAFESGRIIHRDLCGGKADNMNPPIFARYVEETFRYMNGVTTSVMSDQKEIEKEFPLVGAVNRASIQVPRYHGRFITLNYTGEGKIEKTLFFVGKGVTFDSGGADIKSTWDMYHMSRDKCGAAAVAGIIKIFAMLQPRGIHVVGLMPVVRNSFSAEGYVSDEVIKGRSGQRVRITNTDAEGRLILTDALAYAKELAKNAPNPTITSIGTLTYHSLQKNGYDCATLMGNGPANKLKMTTKLKLTGELAGDCIEMSRLRKEDFQTFTASSDSEADLDSFGGHLIERTHQGPAALLLMGSGLYEHGNGANLEIPVFLFDTAGPMSGGFPRNSDAATVVVLASYFALSQEVKDVLGIAVDK